jgi:hypothetical protein
MRGHGRRSSPSCGAMLLSADSGVTGQMLLLLLLLAAVLLLLLLLLA